MKYSSIQKFQPQFKAPSEFYDRPSSVTYVWHKLANIKTAYHLLVSNTPPIWWPKTSPVQANPKKSSETDLQTCSLPSRLRSCWLSLWALWRAVADVRVRVAVWSVSSSPSSWWASALECLLACPRSRPGDDDWLYLLLGIELYSVTIIIKKSKLMRNKN